MFKKLVDTADTTLLFAPSLNVFVYPCSGRHAYREIDDGPGTYYPFDPEAKLATEGNMLKHTGLNGFTQTYLLDAADEDTTLSFVLGGYLFKLELSDHDGAQKTLSEFLTYLGSTDPEDGLVAEGFTVEATKLFANIVIENVNLATLGNGTDTYYYETAVLRNQAVTDGTESKLTSWLDKCFSGDEANRKDYYFTGLSFSAIAITNNSEDVSSEAKNTNTNTGKDQRIISLCLFEKIDDRWTICQQALLPKIEHGPEEHSTKISGLLHTEELDATNISVTENINANQTSTEYLVANTQAVIGEKLSSGKHPVFIRDETGVASKTKFEMSARTGDGHVLMQVQGDKAYIKLNDENVPALTICKYIDDDEYQLQFSTASSVSIKKT